MHKPHQWMVPILVMITAAAGTLQLYRISRDSERQLHYAIFLDAAHGVQHLIDTRINQRLEDLGELQRFLTVTGELDKKTFHDIAGAYLGKRGNIQALEWVPRVADNERDKHEAIARSVGMEAYAIRQRGEDGTLLPAARRSEYFPIFYATPVTGNSSVIGFDLAANDSRRAALEQARDSARPVVTGRVRLLQRNAPGLVMVTPVYQLDRPGNIAQRRRELRGFVLAVFALEDLFAVKQTENVLGVSVVDKSAAPSQQILYRFPPAKPLAHRGKPAFTLTAPLTVADHQWTLTVSQSQRALHAFGAGQSSLVLMLGLLTTVVSGAFVAAAQRNLQRQRQLAQERAARLNNSEAQLNAMFENIQDGLIGINQRGEIEAFNPAAVRLFGHEQQQVLGRNVKMLMPESHASQHNGFIENFLRTGTAKIIGIGREVEGLRRNGSTFPLYLSVAEVPYGEERFFVGIVHDRSAEHAAMNALRRSEERFQLAVAGSRDGLWDWDIPSGKTYFSPRFKQLLGYAENGFADVYDSWASRIHPRERAATLARLDRHLRQGEPYDVELRLKTRRNGYRWFRARGQAIRSEAGIAQRMVGSLTDIHADKKNLIELRRFQITLNMINDCLFIFDPDTLKLNFVNHGACRQLGYTEQELLTMTPYDMNPEFDKKRFREMTRSLIKGPAHSLRFETIHRRKDGSDVPVNIFLQYLAPKDAPHRFAAMIRDISERKQTERKLIEAKQQAEQATKTKSAFLANMSHEIRTPMSGVLGMLELLQGTHLNEQQQRYAETACQAAETLLILINDILDISKVEAGCMTVEHTVFDLCACVEEASLSLAAPAANKGLELICMVDPALPSSVRGDPTRLRQVLINLIGNAIKFTTTGEVGIRVTNRSTDQDQVHVHIEVEDTGIGIAPEQMATLFDPFTQADQSTTRRFGGTGLGLTICKYLVELMGGHIGVESRPQHGTRFWVNLPMTCTDLKGDRVQLGDRLRVLAVDDNATNRQLLSRYLGSWNIQHVCVEDAPTALCCLRQSVEDGEAFDVALVDAGMPGMDGWALVGEIAKNPRLRDIRLIMLSSAGCPAPANKHAAIERYLSKPLRQTDLHAALAAKPVDQPLSTPPPLGSEPRFDGARVLVVDDMPTNRLVAREMLGSRGIEVAMAGTGREAIAALDRDRFDLVLMDCRMPVMDGYAASETIRARERANHSGRTPIIALTAHAMSGERDKCLAAGMDDFLSKPFKSKELFACLAKWLPADRGKDTAQHKPSTRSSCQAGGKEYDGQNALFDETHLKQLLHRPHGHIRELLTAFENDTSKKLAELRQAAGAEDMQAICQATHALKGLCANLAATGVAEQCHLLELLARAGQKAQFAKQVSLIEKLLSRVSLAYEAKILPGKQ